MTDIPTSALLEEVERRFKGWTFGPFAFSRPAKDMGREALTVLLASRLREAERKIARLRGYEEARKVPGQSESPHAEP